MEKENERGETVNARKRVKFQVQGGMSERKNERCNENHSEEVEMEANRYDSQHDSTVDDSTVFFLFHLIAFFREKKQKIN